MPPQYHSRDELLAFANVRGTALGPNDEIIVLVTQKLPESELADDEIIPPDVEIGGEQYETDVEEVHIPHRLGAVQAGEGHRQRYRPAKGGVSIGPDRRSAGTMGSPLLEDRDGDPVLLTNQHVAASPSRNSDRIFQPSLIDGGSSGDVIGILKEATEPSTTETNYSDSALVLVNPEDVGSEIHNLGELVDTDEAKFAFSYTKSGRTTGVTEGSLKGRDGRVRVTSGSDTLLYHGVDIFTDMSAPGDSGSLIGYQTPAGVVATDLLFAGSDTITIGVPFSAVEEAHGPLSVWEESEPEPPEEPEPEPEPPEEPEPEPPAAPGPGPDDGGDVPVPAPSWGQFRHDADIRRIIDGDTMDFETHHGPLNLRSDYRIRLLEIDTAERGHPDFHTHKEFAQQWLAEGVENYSAEDDPSDPNEAYPFILDTFRDELDSFGRLLTRVIRKSDGSDLTEDLLDEYGEVIRYDLEEQLERLLPGGGKGRPRSDD